MPLKGPLTDCEKHGIIAGLAGGLSVLDLAKKLGRAITMKFWSITHLNTNSH